MLKSLKCLLNGHLYVDSRSQAGIQTCVRCRHRKPFEGLVSKPVNPAESDSGPPRND